MTKSGHRGGNFARWSAVNPAKRSRVIQEASGERIAPFGSTKPPEESNVTPDPSRFAQSLSCMLISEFLSLVSPPVGGMIVIPPPAVRSMRRSRLSWQNSKNWSSVRRTTGRSFSDRTAPSGYTAGSGCGATGGSLIRIPVESVDSASIKDHRNVNFNPTAIRQPFSCCVFPGKSTRSADATPGSAGILPA